MHNIPWTVVNFWSPPSDEILQSISQPTLEPTVDRWPMPMIEASIQDHARLPQMWRWSRHWWASTLNPPVEYINTWPNSDCRKNASPSKILPNHSNCSCSGSCSQVPQFHWPVSRTGRSAKLGEIWATWSSRPDGQGVEITKLGENFHEQEASKPPQPIYCNLCSTVCSLWLLQLWGKCIEGDNRSS